MHMRRLPKCVSSIPFLDVSEICRDTEVGILNLNPLFHPQE